MALLWRIIVFASWAVVSIASPATLSGIGECPAKLISPCKCVGEGIFKQAQCTNFTSVSDLQKVFDKTYDRPINDFLLQDSSLMYFKSSWIGKKDMIHLSVGESSLTSLFDVAPAANYDLVLLQLRNVRILRGIQWEHFKPLAGLREIDVDGMEIGHLGKEFTDVVTPQLRKISFKGTKTKGLGDTVFAHLEDMYQFIFTNARLKTLKRSMFHDTVPLYVFSVSNNLIEFLPDDMFKGMDMILGIEMEGNRLMTISEKVFGRLFNLKLALLKLQGNPITCDCRIAWMVPTRVADGACAAPDDLKGRQLMQLTKKDFEYCPKILM